MDFLIINLPVYLDIALSLLKVSKHLTNTFIPSEHFENFNSFYQLIKALLKTDLTITRNVGSVFHVYSKKQFSDGVNGNAYNFFRKSGDSKQ